MARMKLHSVGLWRVHQLLLLLALALHLLGALDAYLLGATENVDFSHLCTYAQPHTITRLAKTR